MGDFKAIEVGKQSAVTCSEPKDRHLLGSIELVDTIFLSLYVESFLPGVFDFPMDYGLHLSVGD